MFACYNLKFIVRSWEYWIAVLLKMLEIESDTRILPMIKPHGQSELSLVFAEREMRSSPLTEEEVRIQKSNAFLI